MRIVPKTWLTVALLLVPSLAVAAPPTLKTLTPPALRRGAAMELLLVGEHFTTDMQLLLPFAADVSGGGSSPEAVRFTIKPAADIPPGVYAVRVRTPEGISNLRQIAVTTTPIISRVRVGLDKKGRPDPAKAHLHAPYRNGKLDLDSAQRIQTPCVLAGGRLSRDVDVYRFTARAGERLVFETLNWRVGLTPDLVLRLCDGRGRALTYAHDTPTLQRDERIDHTFDQAGDYFLEVSATEGGGRNNHYLVQITPYDYARSVFPLGGRRGEPLRLSVVNRDGVTSTIETRVPADPWLDEWRLPLKDFPGSVPWLLAIGDLPEVTEDAERTGPQQLSWPVTVNGRIGKSGEEDLYRLVVKPGEHVRVLVSAYHHGSRLDGYLLVYDPKGRKLLAQNDDQIGRGQPDPGLTFEVPPGVEEVIVVLRDTLGDGGHDYGYRLTVERGGPDFFLRLGNKTYPMRENVGWYWQDSSDTLNLPPGQEVRLPLAVRRSAREDDPHYWGPLQGYMGPITIRAENVPAGVTVKPLVIRPGYKVGELVVIASETAPIQPFEMVIVGEGTRLDGAVFRRSAERQLYLSDPALTNLPWNTRVRKLTCVTTGKAKVATSRPQTRP